MKKYFLSKIVFFAISISFLLIFTLPASSNQEIPSPEEYFGFMVGADFHLIGYEQAVDYWKKLEGLTNRIKLFDYVKSSQGRPMLLAVIALNRLLKGKADVLWARDAFSAGNKTFSPGALIVPLSKFSSEKMSALSRDLSLEVFRIQRPPRIKTHKLKLPRMALYKPWVANMDEGWTRLILENYGFAFVSVHDAEIKAGDLENRFDVIVLPSQRKNSIINGNSKGTMPPPYIGGISEKGVRNLQRFVESGGTLVALGSACDLTIEEFKLPVKNILKSLKPEEFFGSGLLVRATFDRNHPVAYGMPAEAACFFANSPTFQIIPSLKEKTRPSVVGEYGEGKIILEKIWRYFKNDQSNNI